MGKICADYTNSAAPRY